MIVIPTGLKKKLNYILTHVPIYPQESSCSSHSPSLLSACVRRKIPSDENLYELYRRPYDFPPLPRWPRAFPPLPPASVHCTPMYDDGAYFMRRPKSVCSDRNSYSWFSSEDEDMRLVSFYYWHYDSYFVFFFSGVSKLLILLVIIAHYFSNNCSFF